MIKFPTIVSYLFAISLLVSMPNFSNAEDLKSGVYFVTQTWSQEKNFKHPYFVQVPGSVDDKPLPVLIFLHGNGGNAKRAMQGFLNRHRQLRKKFILVFPQGFRESWNIVSEASKANDLGYIESIIDKLSTYDNIQPENFSIMGNSNGAAMVNQITIETKLKNIKNYISAVSPLNTLQHDGKNFKLKGKDNNYLQIAQPRTGIRLMNISGTDDRLVPYTGGLSRVIPAKGGKLGFVDAEQSIFLWAKHMGYKGEKLTKPSSVNGDVETFSYLNGDVIHYKVINGGHGAIGAIREETLLEFLEADSSSQ